MLMVTVREGTVMLEGVSLLSLSRGDNEEYSSISAFIEGRDSNTGGYTNSLDYLLASLEECNRSDNTLISPLDSLANEEGEDITSRAINHIRGEELEEGATLSFKYHQIEVNVDTNHWLHSHRLYRGLELEEGYTILFSLFSDYLCIPLYGEFRDYWHKENKFIQWLGENFAPLDSRGFAIWGTGYTVEYHSSYEDQFSDLELLNNSVEYTYFHNDYREYFYLINGYIFREGHYEEHTLASVSVSIYCSGEDNKECGANYYGEGARYWSANYGYPERIKNLEKLAIVECQLEYQEDIELDISLPKIASMLLKYRSLSEEIEELASIFGNGRKIEELADRRDAIEEYLNKYLCFERERGRYLSGVKYWSISELANELANHNVILSHEDTGEGLCPHCHKHMLAVEAY